MCARYIKTALLAPQNSGKRQEPPTFFWKSSDSRQAFKNNNFTLSLSSLLADDGVLPALSSSGVFKDALGSLGENSGGGGSGGSLMPCMVHRHL